MKRYWVAMVATVVLGACSDHSLPESPTGSTVAPNLSTAPLDTDLVATPAGWYHRDCVHAVANGAHVDIHGSVRLPDGNVYQLPRCSHPGRVALAAPVDNGWIESGAYATGTSWGLLSANWTVPAQPASYASNQVYYSFPGIQSNNYIIQPVMTYGYAPGYGGNSWTAASWHCNDGSDCTHSAAITMAAGDVVLGTVSASGCANNVCTWTITTADVTKGTRSVYTVDDTAGYYYAVGGAVEAYGLTSCNQFPRNGVFYYNISLYDQNQQQASTTWTPNVQSDADPFCAFNVTSTPSTINLYHNDGLDVSVSGPQTGVEYSYVTVTASVAEGAAPFSYSWTINGSPACSNQSTCNGQLGAAYTSTSFAVTVTDANRQQASASTAVTACPTRSPSGSGATDGPNVIC